MMSDIGVPLPKPDEKLSFDIDTPQPELKPVDKNRTLFSAHVVITIVDGETFGHEPVTTIDVKSARVTGGKFLTIADCNDAGRAVRLELQNHLRAHPRQRGRFKPAAMSPDDGR